MTTASARMRTSLVLIVLALFMTACGGRDEQASEAHLQKARSFFSERNYNKARVELRNALKENPHNVPARVLLGDTYVRLGSIGNAFAAYRSAFQLDPKALRAGLRTGLIQIEAGEVDDALKTAERLEKALPGNAGSLLIRAQLAGQRNDLDTALKLAEQAWRKRPELPEAAQIYAAFLFQDGQVTRALELASRAWQQAGDDPAIRDFYVQLLMRMEDWPRAEQVLRQAIQQEPGAIRLRHLMAKVLLAGGKPDKAEAFLYRTWQELPDNSQALQLLSDFLVQHRGLDTALNRLKTLQAEADDPVPIALRRGALLRSAGRLDEAAAVYDDLLKRKGRGNWRERARNALAAIRLQQGQTDAARELADAVLADSPRDPDALLIRAQIALQEHRPLDAVSDLRSVLKAYPTSKQVRHLLARAHELNGDTALARQNLQKVLEIDPKDVQAILGLARLDQQAGQPQQAIERLKKAWDPKDGDPRITVQLVRLLLQQKRAKEALDIARQIQQNQPGSALGHVLAGLANQSRGDDDKAIAELQRAVAADPDSPVALSLLVAELLERDQYDAAEHQVRQAIQQHSRSALLHALLGRVQVARGDLAAAENSLIQATQLQPDWVGGWWQLARVQGSAGHVEAAIRSAQRALQLAPETRALQIELAVLQDRAGHAEAARQIYTQLLQKNPRDVVAANNLAMLLVREPGRNARQLQDLLPVLASVEHPELWDSRGWIALQLGRTDEAVELLKRAVQASPNDGGFYYHLARAELQQGHREAARRHLATALAHKDDLEPQERRAALKLFKDLGQSPDRAHEES